MSRIYTCLLLLIFIITPAYTLADVNLEQAHQSIATDNGNAEACSELEASGATAEILAKRGCCSHHKGVCGCSGGRVTCCDGTTSPSCTCHRDDNPETG